MATITIEKGVPLPTNVVIQRKTLYPFASMKKGDSFWAPNKRSVSGASNQYKKKYDNSAEFLIAPEVNAGVPGARIWKIR